MARSPLPSEPPELGEVRKVVTVVFTDVIGSTEIGERLDPETVRRVMSLYFEAMREELERHGGSVEKYIGDAVMAVFGLPSLHEDDALRALHAVLRTNLVRILRFQPRVDLQRLADGRR